MDWITPPIGLALLAYLVATATPGPATMAIMAIALADGRRPAYQFALGVLTGAMLWALVTLSCVAILLTTQPQLIMLLQLVGGAYLFWMSWRAATATGEKRAGFAVPGNLVHSRFYVKGLLLHLTNVKAMLAWTSMAAIAFPEGAHWRASLALFLGCGCIATSVCFGYGWLFSKPAAQQIYQRYSHWLNGILAGLFLGAGAYVWWCLFDQRGSL